MTILLSKPPWYLVGRGGGSLVSTYVDLAGSTLSSLFLSFALRSLTRHSNRCRSRGGPGTGTANIFLVCVSVFSGRRSPGEVSRDTHRAPLWHSIGEHSARRAELAHSPGSDLIRPLVARRRKRRFVVSPAGRVDRRVGRRDLKSDGELSMRWRFGDVDVGRGWRRSISMSNVDVVMCRYSWKYW